MMITFENKKAHLLKIPKPANLLNRIFRLIYLPNNNNNSKEQKKNHTNEIKKRASNKYNSDITHIISY